MNAMKRLGLTALVVALGALVTASPALAGMKLYSTTFQLAPPIGAPEADASGKWTLDVYGLGEWKGQEVLPRECATVSCQRLTPGQQYVVQVLVQWYTSPYGGSGLYFEEHAVTADQKGRLRAEVWVWSEAYEAGWGDGAFLQITNRHIADLWIVNADGQIVLETVPEQP